MKNTSVILAARVISKFVQYFILVAYIPWSFSVLKYSSGANMVDARELLIYAFSFLGLGLSLNTSQNKFVEWIERP